MLQKGIALATMPYYYKKCYKKYLDKEKFDWVLMPTPPITLGPTVGYIKKKSGAKFYLILRDIHPHSIWSIGLLKYKFMYNYLDKKASYTYQIADLIGCTSQGNIDFVTSHYPTVDKKKFVILHNWLKENVVLAKETSVRNKYGIDDKFMVIFGGTIGKGQRIENLLYLANEYLSNRNIVFVVIGKGVEKDRLMRIARDNSLDNMLFINYMPQEDYLNFVKSADLGLISINEKYVVPTCPLKAASYMSLQIPILAMINANSDYGPWIEKAGAGFWAVGSDKNRVKELFNRLYSNKNLRKQMGTDGYNFYKNNLTVDVVCDKLINQIESYDLV